MDKENLQLHIRIHTFIEEGYAGQYKSFSEMATIAKDKQNQTRKSKEHLNSQLEKAIQKEDKLDEIK